MNGKFMRLDRINGRKSGSQQWLGQLHQIRCGRRPGDYPSTHAHDHAGAQTRTSFRSALQLGRERALLTREGAPVTWARGRRHPDCPGGPVPTRPSAAQLLAQVIYRRHGGRKQPALFTSPAWARRWAMVKRRTLHQTLAGRGYCSWRRSHVERCAACRKRRWSMLSARQPAQAPDANGREPTTTCSDCPPQ